MSGAEDQPTENAQARRRLFGLKDQVAPALSQDYHSALIERIRAGGHELAVGATRIVLAGEFGFCYGVDRAVELAYETIERFPGKRIHITAEIIHNPLVNRRLRDLGVQFLSDDPAAYDRVQPDDVVIWPAFGVSVAEQKRLADRGCLMVDATCGSVIHVWRRVERYARAGLTSVIHGKHRHEETIATASRAVAAGGPYLVVFDDAEARILCDRIENNNDPGEFRRRFAPAASPGFDPVEHVKRIGVANQTTMLAGESLRIADMVRAALARRYGEDYLKDNFLSFDTICSATQDRQDAMLKMREKHPGIVLVVGGFNSSNTGHLREIAAEFAAAYHIDGPDCLVSAGEIRHLPGDAKEPATAADWLPSGPLTIGVTAGASTPNRVTGAVIERVLELRNDPPRNDPSDLSDPSDVTDP